MFAFSTFFDRIPSTNNTSKSANQHQSCDVNRTKAHSRKFLSWLWRKQINYASQKRRCVRPHQGKRWENDSYNQCSTNAFSRPNFLEKIKIQTEKNETLQSASFRPLFGPFSHFSPHAGKWLRFVHKIMSEDGVCLLYLDIITFLFLLMPGGRISISPEGRTLHRSVFGPVQKILLKPSDLECTIIKYL